jgi:prepilin signal peptidase PulO-like enzyme (type II secretory pathway)
LGVIFGAYSLYYFPWNHWLYGFLIGLLFPLGVTWAFYILKGQIGLGGGDIKLFAILGLYLGPRLIIHNIFFSCFLGSIIGLSLILSRKISKDNPIPFGPFILIVAVIQIFFPSLFSKYLLLL